MTLKGLDHIQLAIPPDGEDTAREFYGELLGLEEVAKPGPLIPRGGCWFAGPGIALHLGVQTDFVPARKAHPAFLVADLAAFRKVLEAKGISITNDEALPHIPRFYAADPFGNRIEFIEDGEGSSQRNWA